MTRHLSARRIEMLEKNPPPVELIDQSQTVRLIGKWPAPFDELVDARIIPPKMTRCARCAQNFDRGDVGFAATIVIRNVGGFRPHYARRFWHHTCFGPRLETTRADRRAEPFATTTKTHVTATEPQPAAINGAPAIDWRKEPVTERERRAREFLLNAKSPHEIMELRKRYGTAPVASDLSERCAYLRANDLGHRPT